ncbi:MAG: hypothetical protein ACE37F_11555 [Nannocystaceae bacterium]|nr:hypothetical protein [bacterium]
MAETKHHRDGSKEQPMMVAPDTSHDTGRPQNLALPNSREFWQLLERYNKAALTRRFPGWSEPRPEARAGC